MDWVSVRMAQAIWSKKIVSCLNGSSCACKKNCHLFERLRLSVQKKLSAVWMARAIHAKKLFSVGTAQAIRLKKTVSHLKSLGYPLQKIGDHSKARSSHLFKEKFSRISISEQFPHQPLVSNDLLFSRYSWVVPIWTLFTNVSWIVTVLFLPLPHPFHHPFSHSISKGLVTPVSSVCLPSFRILCIVCREHFWVRGHIHPVFEVNEILLHNNCTIHCSYWNTLYQNDFVVNNQLMMG